MSALCPDRGCGCSFESDTLSIMRTGSTVQIDLTDAYNGSYPVFNFLNAAERDATITSPQENMECRLRADDSKWWYDGTAWRLIEKSADYTPVLTGGHTLGSGGALAGHYSRSGFICTFNAYLIWGTGMNINAVQAVAISLPFQAASSYPTWSNALSVSLHDVGSAVYDGAAILASTVVNVGLDSTSTYSVISNGISNSTPHGWAAGDVISVSGSYMVDPTST